MTWSIVITLNLWRNVKESKFLVLMILFKFRGVLIMASGSSIKNAFSLVFLVPNFMLWGYRISLIRVYVLVMMIYPLVSFVHHHHCYNCIARLYSCFHVECAWYVTVDRSPSVD